MPINVGDASYDPQFPYGWVRTILTEVPEGGAATLRALGRGRDRPGGCGKAVEKLTAAYEAA
ncbi:hypothetical protein GCM10027074_49050 [Streptomyces deserti]